MFVKITKSNGYQYVQIVKAYRENRKVKHEVMLNLGRLDAIENNPSIQRLGKRLMEISRAKDVVGFGNISEAKIINWGYIIYKRLWQKFGLDGLLDRIQARGRTKFSLSDTSLLMVLSHLLDPRSKLGTHLRQNRYAKLPDINLNSMYRALDILCEAKDLIEEELFFQNRNLFNMSVDMVFYDVTTFSFESVKADSLRDFGFSKNGKFNEVQVVMGLIVDQQGRPIGYDLFPGNTFDGSTIDAALEKLEKRFSIRKVIIVADKGINSKLNLKKITDKGYGYIFACRIKSMGEKTVGEITSGPFAEIEHAQEKIKYKVIDHTNRFKADQKIYELKEKLIITYSAKRAEKDRADRQRLIDKANRLLEDKSKIAASNKRGGKKYLKATSATSWVLDEAAIKKDKVYDGYYGIVTSETDLKPEDILDAYHSLWKIEESFRIMKSTLEVRPVFHWTEKRIKGHFVICFLAFLLEATLEAKLKDLEEASPENIREAINSLNFAQVEIDSKRYYIKTTGTGLSNKILRKLKISPPKSIMAVEEFNP